MDRDLLGILLFLYLKFEIVFELLGGNCRCNGLSLRYPSVAAKSDVTGKLIYVLHMNVGMEKSLREDYHPELPSSLVSPLPHFPPLLNVPSPKKRKLIYSLAKSAVSVEFL